MSSRTVLVLGLAAVIYPGTMTALAGLALLAAGGWYYSPDSDRDEGSVTVTQIQGLRAARNAELALKLMPDATGTM
jgi:hypothetical protein